MVNGIKNYVVFKGRTDNDDISDSIYNQKNTVQKSKIQYE